MDKGREKGASGFGGLTDDESTHGAIGVAASEAGLMGVLINSCLNPSRLRSPWRAQVEFAAVDSVKGPGGHQVVLCCRLLAIG